MAVTEYKGRYGTYYAGGSLTVPQQEANAIYIGKYLIKEGWTLQAVAGLCGNIECEIHFNPGGKEIGGTGYGLIQWTPGTIHSEWCKNHGISDPTTMDANLAHICWEAENNESWYKKAEFTESYLEFTKSIKSPYYLANVYLWNRERSGITLWGFHRGMQGDVDIDHTDYHVTPPHTGRTYCSKKAYDDSFCKYNCNAYKYCYWKRYGNELTAKQIIKNQNDKKKERGTAAEKWYKFLWKELYARLDKSDTSVLTNKYWISSKSAEGRAKGGLNYNHAVEQWPTDDDKDGVPNAMEGASSKDWDRIRGTYTTLPNCTSWAWGRAYEIMGEAPPIFKGDAGNWWNCYTEEALSALGYTKSQTPSYGAIACWQNPKKPTVMGHVAIVEDIDEEKGTITISESGYRTWSWAPSYFNIQTRANRADYKTRTNTYKFVGYIGLRGYGDAVTDVPPTINSFELTDLQAEEASFLINITENETPISRIYYSLNDGTIQDLDIATGDISFTVSGRVPVTDYAITVTAEAGTAAAISNEILFTTLQSYPDPVRSVSIKSNTNKNLESEVFSVSVKAPDNWGYWQRVGKDFGYRVFPTYNCKLETKNSFDITLDRDKTFDIARQINPNKLGISHEDNFQICVSSWVIGKDDKTKVFAEIGELCPVGSNSVCLKEISEISDNSFLFADSKIRRAQPYIKTGSTKSFKPAKIFIQK